MRAAASSTASGRSSRRAQSSAISSVGSSCRALAEEADRFRGCERRYGVLDLALHAQELATRAEERQVGAGLHERAESAGAASITCSRLSSRRSSSRSPMCSARSSFAPSV